MKPPARFSFCIFSGLVLAWLQSSAQCQEPQKPSSDSTRTSASNTVSKATTPKVAAPKFERVDPPSWWTESTVNPVRLLIRGENLSPGTIIESPNSELLLYNFRSSDNGHYLFADLQIPDKCKPGSYELLLKREGFPSDMFTFQVTSKSAHFSRGFSSEDTIYFIMPDRFSDGDSSNNKTTKSPDLYDRNKPRHYHGGDLQGVIDHLDYIHELGATAIWLTPVYDNNDGHDFKEAYPNSKNQKEPTTGYHGYGAIDMYAVDEHLGSLDTLKELVEKAHGKGLKVIQDQVANHTGPYHVWADDPPTPTWWNGTLDHHSANNWQKWTSMNRRATRQTQLLNLNGWFIDILPDFNQDDPEVSIYLIQNSIWWLENAGFDAIRMDTLPHVPRPFWSKWGSAIKQEFPTVTILGELFDSDPVLLSYFQTGRIGHDGVDTQIDSLFDFGLFGPIRSVFAKGKSIREIQQMFARDWLYPDADSLTTFVGVHDMLRFMNEEGATIDGLKMAFTLILTSRGTPLIYYGDEIAMRGGNDPDNRRDFPGGFEGDNRNAFSKVGRKPEENDVWNHVSTLANLRGKNDALRWGKSLDLLDAEQQYAYARVADVDAIVVVFNNDTVDATLEFDIDMISTETLRSGWSFQCIDVLGKAPPLVVEKGHAKITLPKRSSGVFVLP